LNDIGIILTVHVNTVLSLV